MALYKEGSKSLNKEIVVCPSSLIDRRVYLHHVKLLCTGRRNTQTVNVEGNFLLCKELYVAANFVKCCCSSAMCCVWTVNVIKQIHWCTKKLPNEVKGHVEKNSLEIKRCE